MHLATKSSIFTTHTSQTLGNAEVDQIRLSHVLALSERVDCERWKRRAQVTQWQTRTSVSGCKTIRVSGRIRQWMCYQRAAVIQSQLLAAAQNVTGVEGFSG